MYVDQLKPIIRIKMFYQKYSNFLFKFRWPVIFEPVVVRKSYVPQKKALNSGK